MFRGYFVVLSTALSNLRHQKASYLSAIATIALVMAILTTFTALGSGFNRIVSNTGSDTTAILLQTGAQSEGGSSISGTDVVTLRSVLSDARVGQSARLSPELLMILATQTPAGRDMRVSVRGMDEVGLAFRTSVRAELGDLFAPGSDQVVIGARLADSLGVTEPGQIIVLGRASWTVAGVFSAGDSIYESEIWASRDAMAAAYGRGADVQSIRVAMDSPQEFIAVKAAIEADPRISLSTTTEKAYFAASAGSVGDIVFYIGWPLAIIMAFGALTGAINTISSSVSARAHHLASLRALGARPFAVFLGVMSEALVQALLGAIIGGAAVWALLSDFQVSTRGEALSNISFGLNIVPETLVYGFVLCGIIGLLSGLTPALRISRGNIARLLNAS